MEKQIKRKGQWVPNMLQNLKKISSDLKACIASLLYGVFSSYLEKAKYLHVKDFIRISLMSMFLAFT